MAVKMLFIVFLISLISIPLNGRPNDLARLEPDDLKKTELYSKITKRTPDDRFQTLLKICAAANRDGFESHRKNIAIALLAGTQLNRARPLREAESVARTFSLVVKNNDIELAQLFKKSRYDLSHVPELYKKHHNALNGCDLWMSCQSREMVELLDALNLPFKHRLGSPLLLSSHSSNMLLKSFLGVMHKKKLCKEIFEQYGEQIVQKYKASKQWQYSIRDASKILGMYGFDISQKNRNGKLFIDTLFPPNEQIKTLMTSLNAYSKVRKLFKTLIQEEFLEKRKVPREIIAIIFQYADFERPLDFLDANLQPFIPLPQAYNYILDINI